MKRNLKNITWGIVLVVVGILLGLSKAGILNFNLFFPGWWTLFIIIPSVIGIITDDDKIGNIIGTTIGVLLLLGCNHVISFDLILDMIFPIILVAIGLSFLLPKRNDKETTKHLEKLTKKIDEKEGLTATFAGHEVKIDNEEFKGTNLNAIFGGIDLDLRKAIIKDDIVINATSIFGGIDIKVPDNYKVKVKSNAIFGGVSNKRESNIDDKAKTIYINATCIFGGVDIK